MNDNDYLAVFEKKKKYCPWCERIPLVYSLLSVAEYFH